MTDTEFALDRFVTDPLGALAKARREGWLVNTEPFLAVVRHRDVRELLADPRFKANFPDFLEALGVTEGTFHDWMVGSPLNHDGEAHRQWRSVMTRTFTPKSVEKLRPTLTAEAHALVDGFADRGSCEFVEEFADEFPSIGLCELIGVPREDRDRFRGWANDIGIGFSPVDAAMNRAKVDAALDQLLAYSAELVAKRRVEPGDDLVTRIALAADEEEGWDDDLLVGALAGLVFAGHETTKNQLGWTIFVLADHPDVWDGVGEGRIEAAPVVEEVLRQRSAATAVGRRVDERVERNGTVLEPGTSLLLSLWSANHDESAFDAPDTFDLEANQGAPHLAFGHGAHHCLGAALARAELQEALAVLTARITCPRLEDGAIWKPPIGINGPDRLPITFTARA